ncbi:tail protein [Streptococcus phage vb_Spy_7]|nr:tail protein [Streptococcus phage vb_Spy_7]
MAEFISNNDRGYRIRLWLDQVSQNDANNTSQVRVRLALLNNYMTFAEYDCSAFVDINGQRLNWSGRPDMLSYNSTLWLIDTTITVTHNPDGKKTIGFMAQFTGSGGYSPGTLNIGGNSFDLTTIPRASSVSAVSGTIGSGVTINISRASDSFTHKVRYQWGNTSGDIASNVGTSVTWTIPLTFANEIPNSTSGNGTVFVDTYSGSTMIGTKSTSLTATVPTSMVPTLSGITLSDSNATAGSLVPGNSFVQIISDIKVAFSGAAGTYGSTITGFRAEIVGKNAGTTSNGGTLGAMNWTGAATVRAYVTDSRGRQSAARDVTIDVLAYHPPVLSFNIKRVGTSSSTLQVIRSAKIAPLKVNEVQKNILNLTFRVAEVGSTTYTPDNGSANASLTTQWELVNSPANLAGTYIGSKSYVIIGTLSDKFSSVEFKAEIATESVVMSYSRNGVGIGKIWERGSLDVAGPIYSGNKLIQHHQVTQDNGRAFFHGANFDFNVNLINRQVSCNQPLNGPSVGTGPNQFYVDIIGDSDNYLMQRAVQKETGRTFVRTRHNGTWSPWVETALTNHTNLINTGWQSMGYPGSYYKRVGDVLTIKYSFTGNGGTINFGNIPASVWVAPQSLMLVIAMWAVAGNDNTHVQVSSGTGDFNALATRSGNNYVGMLTIMI